MKSALRFPSFLLVLLGLLTPRLEADGVAPSQLRILSLEPTVLFPQREPLAQLARLVVVNDSGAPLHCEAVVTVQGGAQETTSGLELAPNQSVVELLVPDISAAANVKVELRGSGGVLGTLERNWQPQRKWKVHLVKSSHEDLGYENYIFKKQHDIADFIDLAHEIVRPRVVDESGTKRSVGYHYAMETIIFQRNYLEERGEPAWRELVEGELKHGSGLSLMGAPSGVHTHWMDYEEIARVGYPARRETKDRFGLDINTIMIVDNPSLSWSGMQAFAASGIKYVGRWGQDWRSGGNNNYATTKLPALFWWQAPDGEHRVLFGWAQHYGTTFWWGQTNGGYGNLQLLGDLPAVWVNRYLQSVESGQNRGPYPYDAIIVPSYQDHETPKFDDRGYNEWRKKYAFPEIKFESPERFFAYIEKQYGDKLPTLSGDLNNFSADYASIDPVSQDWKRQAARLLPAAEGLGVLAASADPAFSLLPAQVERLYTRLFDYDEHSWPTLPMASDEQLFNASWVKNKEARRALDGATEQLARAATVLARNIAGAGEGTIAVFNPLAHSRSDLIEAPGQASAVTDLRTGQSIPCEPAGEGRFTFLASDIPPFGYALYRLESKTAGAPAVAGELQAGRLSISNRYYTVRFHPESGTVTSIVDLTNGQELIDQAAPYRANQLVYVHKKEREAKEGFEYSPAKAVKMESHPGINQVSFDVWIDDATLGGRVRQTVTLRAGIKRVDFVNRLESIDVMFAPTYTGRYRDNIYYAFPFAVPGGQIRVEYPGGVVRPYDDQLRWGSHDFLYANRWVDVSNAERGVTLAAREAGTFSFGEIRYNQFSIDYKPTKPWVFNYAWSNRMAGLLTLQPDDCNATFTYSLTSHEGDWNTGAVTKFGWQTASPLLALPVTGTTGPWTEKAKSFLAVDAANVQLTVLKASGQPGRGWIARLIETEGRATDAVLDASALGVAQAVGCDLVENDGVALPVEAGKVRVSLRPFGFATVRLLSGGPPGGVGGIEASDVTDSTVRLSWPTVAGGKIGYNVYRSVDPDAPATAYTLVARTGGPQFIDQGLNLATNYYYRVAAVTAANLEGPPSKLRVVRTSPENKSPPGPVQELGVVRRSADTLIVYWRRNPEPDVAHYRVFRSEAADFSMAGGEPLAVVDANSYFLQIYRDHSVEPGKTYFYRVQPIDWAGNRQPVSSVVSATTPGQRQ